MLLQKRRLGRTKLNVSIVGFGGTWISDINQSQAVRVVRKAFDCGINYFDTAKLDGDSEEKMGLALKDVRDKCVIATKTGCRTKGESLVDIKNSLGRLGTDHLDIIQLHGIDDERTLRKAMGYNGVLQTCRQARSEGMVDFIGITSHRPRVLVKAIKTGEFDTVLVPLNVVTRQALEELIPTAKEHDVGVVIMKPLSAKTSNLITCLYQPSLSLLSDEPDLHALLGANQNAMARSALRYVLAQDISVTIPGLRTIKQVEVAAKAGQEFAGLTEDEKNRFNVNLEVYCRDCGLCIVCTEKVNVPAILRFYALYLTYGLKGWAKKLYQGLEVKADKCSKCGKCELLCPYRLPVIDMLERAETELRG
jgi:uncharacterized protein